MRSIKPLLVILCACGASATSTPSGESASSSAATERESPASVPDSYLIAFITTKEDTPPEARQHYATQVDEIAATYGIEHAHSYRVARPFSGALAGASEVHLWRLPSSQAFEDMLRDPAYLALTPERERLHETDQFAMYIAEAALDGPQLDSPFVLVDLVFLNDGFTLQDRAEYGRSMGPIADRYGLGVSRSFRNLRHQSGLGVGAVELNFWEVSDPNLIGQVLQDPEYQALIPLRDRIHDMQRLTMLLAQPIS